MKWVIKVYAVYFIPKCIFPPWNELQSTTPHKVNCLNMTVSSICLWWNISMAPTCYIFCSCEVKITAVKFNVGCFRLIRSGDCVKGQQLIVLHQLGWKSKSVKRACDGDVSVNRISMNTNVANISFHILDRLIHRLLWEGFLHCYLGTQKSGLNQMCCCAVTFETCS